MMSKKMVKTICIVMAGIMVLSFVIGGLSMLFM
mgnify:CR=1 FL=1